MVRTFIACGSAAALLLAMPTPPTHAAQAARVVDCNVAVNNDALVIQKVTVGDAPVDCYWFPGPSRKYVEPAAFQAGDDWLQDLSITFYNRTNKTIAYILIGLGFPQTQPERAVNINLGHIPDIAAFDRQGKPLRQDGQKPLSLGPGETLVVNVRDYISQINGALESALSVPVTKVTIQRIGCNFDDGMHWNPGPYSIPDSQHPGQWKRLATRSYFPGNPLANWPPTAIGSGR